MQFSLIIPTKVSKVSHDFLIVILAQIKVHTLQRVNDLIQQRSLSQKDLLRQENDGIRPVKGHGSFLDRPESLDRPQEARFAARALAHDEKVFALGDGQVQVGDEGSGFSGSRKKTLD